MAGTFLDQSPQNARRDAWFAHVRDHVNDVVNPDGSGKIPQFNAPWREPVWILPALYTGAAEHVALANRMVEYYHQAPSQEYGQYGTLSGKRWNIFQSNVFAHCLHRFHGQLTPAASEVMQWHAEATAKTYGGAAQPDYKFHGANDNMPMMASYGCILGGEATGNTRAIEHGVMNLHLLRRQLSRGAWLGEFNSSTYTAITLTGAAKIATFSRDPEIRELALEIEQRIWAEVILHFHPGTFMQAGPHCRAYMIDCAGHTHTLQTVLWMAFGPEISGRDPLRTYFDYDGIEVIHFKGCRWQSVAEYCDALDCDLHVPADLAPLMTARDYPAHVAGRSESLSSFANQCGSYHTRTWMDPDCSLGTVDIPLVGGKHTNQLYLTYKRRPEPRDFRDAGTAYVRFLAEEFDFDQRDTADDGGSTGEHNIVVNQGWCYAMQRDNVGLLLASPNLKDTPAAIATLKLVLIVPAHYGRIERSIIGAGKARDGASGDSAAVAATTAQVGEVFIHVQPLLPTRLPRGAALRWRSWDRYETLELVNYEGPARAFSRAELIRVLNGMLVTIVPRRGAPDLETVHRQLSDLRIQDYLFFGHRFLRIERADVEFEVTIMPETMTRQCAAIDGRTMADPVFATDQYDIARLPFTTGPVAPMPPLWPWGDSLEVAKYDEHDWLIGARGLPGEIPYRNPVEHPDK